jgi:hypothetical protein
MWDEVRSYHSVKNYYSNMATKCATDFEAVFEFYLFLTGPDVHMTVLQAFYPFVVLEPPRRRRMRRSALHQFY